ncbi:MAG: M1 family aminopeptidase [Candidatus Kapaibacterium sp.]
MKTSGILFFVLMLLPVILISQPSGPFENVPQNFDVLSYSAEIELPDIPEPYIKGRNTITLTWNPQADDHHFYFHLHSLSVDSVKYKDSLILFSREESETDFYYSVELDDEDSSVIDIYYHGIMTVEDNAAAWGGVHSDNGMVYALGVGFLNDYVSATRHWLPCYDHPSDKALFEAVFTVSPPNTVASNGLMIDSAESDGKKLLHWKQESECSTYLLTFAAGPLFRTDYTQPGGVPIHVYHLEHDNIDPVLSSLPQQVEIMESYFTPYPLEKVGYVITNVGSMEHQGLISFSRSLLNNPAAGKETALHELSHMWFGDHVSPMDFRDAWLNEGFAVFCESLDADYNSGRTEYLNSVNKSINNYLSNISQSEGVFPLYDFKASGSPTNYPQTIYQKGAGVMALLREKLGDGDFFKALNNYLIKYAEANTSSELFKEELEKQYGMQLDDFFNSWVYGRGWPELALSFEGYTVEGFVDVHYVNKMRVRQVQPKSYGGYNYVPVALYFNQSDTTLPFIMTSIDTTFHFGDYIMFNNIKNATREFPLFYKITTINKPVSAKEEIALKVKLYPQPAKDKLILESGLNQGLYSLQIVNTAGKILLKKSLAGNKFEIDCSNFPAGNYLLILEKDVSRIVRKFVIAR